MRTSRRTRWRFAFATTILLTVVGTNAVAETPSEKQRAEQLFDAASTLVKQGDIKAACPKFEESQRLDPALGTQFNLAHCYQQLGRLGSAWRNFRAVEQLAHTTGKTAREEAAHKHLVELRPYAPHFVFSVVDQDATLTINGERLERDDWSYYPVDPGEHVIEATASAKAPWKTRLLVVASPNGSGSSVPVAVPRLAVAAGETRIVTVTKETNKTRTIGLALVGVGIAGLAAAGVTGVLYLDAKSTADERCRPISACDQEGYDAARRGKTLVVLNYAAWGVGATGLAVGTVLFITSSRSKSRSAARVWPVLSADSAGVAASGSF